MLKIVGKVQKNKPTVLFLSGGMVTPAVYDQVEGDGTFQFIAIDYCQSEGPWELTGLGKRVGQYIVEAELGPTVLVGWSAGGVIAMAAASQYPERIAGMLLSNTGPCATNHGKMDVPQKIQQRWGETSLYEEFIDGWFSRPVPPFLREKMIAYMSSLEKECAFQITTSVRSVDYREPLKNFHAPVVVAHGNLDKGRTTEHVKMICESMPQTEVFLFEAGHTSVVENRPEWQKAFNYLLDKVHTKYQLS